MTHYALLALLIWGAAALIVTVCGIVVATAQPSQRQRRDLDAWEKEMSHCG